MAHVVVINLNRDTGRMAHMRAQLARCGVDYRRFAALQGDQLPVELARYFPFGAPLSPGEIGCYASHLAIMGEVARGETPSPTLVLEDDVGLPDDLQPFVDALIGALPLQWDIVRLSYHTKSVSRPIARVGRGHNLIRYTRVPTTTGAYLISATGARKFLDRRPRHRPIDHDLRRVWEWGLDTYGVDPPLVRHGVLDSSSIDRLSPAGRACDRRNCISTTSPFARVRQGLHDFGARRWIASGLLNAAARLTPKPMRPAFVQWANARLS